jgi:Ca2+-binding RTX toxin-like protein
VIGVDTDDARIAGGSADDSIVAGLGQNQILTGNGGTDTFILGGTDGSNYTISDFAGDDKLDFTISAGDFNVTAAADGHAVVQYAGSTINLLGVTPGDLSQANFILPTGSSVDFQDRQGNSGDGIFHHMAAHH